MTDENDTRKKKTPYAKYAFANAYNLSLIGGAAAVAAITGNWFIGVAAAGAEALWMLFAPGSRLLRKTWFDRQHAELLAEEDRKRLDGQVNAMPAEEAVRCVALRAK